MAEIKAVPLGKKDRLVVELQIRTRNLQMKFFRHHSLDYILSGYDDYDEYEHLKIV